MVFLRKLQNLNKKIYNFRSILTIPRSSEIDSGLNRKSPLR